MQINAAVSWETWFVLIDFCLCLFCVFFDDHFGSSAVSYFRSTHQVLCLMQPKVSDFVNKLLLTILWNAEPLLALVFISCISCYLMLAYQKISKTFMVFLRLINWKKRSLSWFVVCICIISIDIQSISYFIWEFWFAMDCCADIVNMKLEATAALEFKLK